MNTRSIGFAPKQLDYIHNAIGKWNLAHGSVRSGKTVGTLYAFMVDVEACPDSDIYIVGHSADTAYRNVISLLFNNPEFVQFRKYCTWSPGRRELKYKDKTIKILGALNEGAIGNFQGNTWSLGLCDEITLYPESIIDMIDTRLSKPYSKCHAAMNPSYPTHKVKKWIDKAIDGDPNYFQMQFTLDDNPFVDEDYKSRIQNSLSGVFYKRNFLGLWCLAEGAIFDFFDKDIHVVSRPPRAAEYYIAGIDYGTNNAFSCVLMGVNTGISTQLGVSRWFEKEYVWNSKNTGRQKTNDEYAKDIEAFLEPYGVKAVYVDPSAASFKLELQRRGFRVVDADNDVLNGLSYFCSEMQKGTILVCKECKNLIKELETYVWDDKKAKIGEDAPLKKDDHSIDAARYAVFTHKPQRYEPYKQSSNDYLNRRFG